MFRESTTTVPLEPSVDNTSFGLSQDETMLVFIVRNEAVAL